MINTYKIQSELIYKLQELKDKSFEIEFYNNKYVFIGTSDYIVRIPKKELLLKFNNNKNDKKHNLTIRIKNLFKIKYNENFKASYVGTLINSPCWKEPLIMFENGDEEYHVIRQSKTLNSLKFENLDKINIINKWVLIYDKNDKVCCVLKTE